MNCIRLPWKIKHLRSQKKNLKNSILLPLQNKAKLNQNDGLVHLKLNQIWFSFQKEKNQLVWFWFSFKIGKIK